MPRNIVLDTNIYRKNPKRSDLSFLAVERLCKAEVLKLHIPHMVRREFETYQRSTYQTNLNQAVRSLASIIRLGLTAPNETLTKGIKDQLEAASEQILTDAEQSLQRWALEVDATLPELTEDQYKKAMEAYFLGAPPLSEPKIRADIPDSLIFQQITGLVGAVPLYIVSADSKLAEACKGLENVQIFTDLSDFIESKEIQQQLFALDVKENPANLGELIKQHVTNSESTLESIHSVLLESLISETINSPHIPDDNNEATIRAYGDLEDLELDFDEMTYFGNGNFGVPFRFDTEVNADFYIYKPDYYTLDRQYSVSDHNDHYFCAEEEFSVRVSGVVRLSVPLDDVAALNGDDIGDVLSIQADSVDDIDLLGFE